jgi:hypothetical protein
MLVGAARPDATIGVRSEPWLLTRSGMLRSMPVVLAHFLTCASVSAATAVATAAAAAAGSHAAAGVHSGYSVWHRKVVRTHWRQPSSGGDWRRYCQLW